MAHVKAYLDIQSIMIPNLRYTTKVDGPLLDGSVLNCILQPLVENAIIHGFRDKDESDTSIITIQVNASDGTGDSLIIDVKDNGSGVDPVYLNNVLNRKEGTDSRYGISNVHRRIQIHFGPPYGLRYLWTEQGT